MGENLIDNIFKDARKLSRGEDDRVDCISSRQLLKDRDMAALDMMKNIEAKMTRKLNAARLNAHTVVASTSKARLNLYTEYESVPANK